MLATFRIPQEQRKTLFDSRIYEVNIDQFSLNFNMVANSALAASKSSNQKTEYMQMILINTKVEIMTCQEIS